MKRHKRDAVMHAKRAAIAAVITILLSTYAYLFAQDQDHEKSISFGCFALVALTLATIEVSESIRCLRIAARWFNSERKQS